MKWQNKLIQNKVSYYLDDHRDCQNHTSKYKKLIQIE